MTPALARARTPGIGAIVAVELIAGGREKTAVRGPVASIHQAELTVAVEGSEQLVGTGFVREVADEYWRFLSRISLGILRRHSEPDHVSLVVVSPRAALLRFRAPRYAASATSEEVEWGIDRGLLVAGRGRGQGLLRISIERLAHSGRDPGKARLLMRMEVLGYYPRSRGHGWFAPMGAWIYGHTQAQIHRIVLRGFMRSLAGRGS
jgi:hypothetical protein